jgi:CDP-6-deoxy-D-xylo-4-hexulose-3-dehydrase
MSKILKKHIVSYYRKNFQVKTFTPGESPISVSGKVFNEKELVAGVESVLDGWWTEGRFAIAFEKEFSRYLGVRYVSLVNSGSSANLVALTSLTSSIFGKRALQPGDEVITVACGFPTTVNPIIQNRLVPVFLDVDLGTKNVRSEDLEGAISKKTKAIIMAHTLGNLLPIDAILRLVKKYNLWFIEDCCDALGSRYRGKLAGTFGHVATFSFYPAHQITMGEGGAVATSNPLIHRAIRQFRDWGRDCWCDTGRDNTCGKRFTQQLGQLPYGFDHKYTYSQIGYNLKLTDMQAAIGLAQMAKLPKFVAARKKNFHRLQKLLASPNLRKYLILPEIVPGADPSWFGFPLVVADGAPFTKNELVDYLEKRKIATRALFAGNILRHPAFVGRRNLRVIGKLIHSDKLMNDGFWVGVYPGLNNTMLDFIVASIVSFIHAKTRK